jgi:chemotaxis regulatin CheY-phosphate phosphatase CheZ
MNNEPIATPTRSQVLRGQPTVTAVVRIVEARRELAQESFRLLIDGLRSGVGAAIDIGLRGLGIRENSEIYNRVATLANALSSVRSQLRGADKLGCLEQDGLGDVTSELQQVIAISRVAARRTTGLTENVSELLHQQAYALEIATELVNAPNIPDHERVCRLNQFLEKQKRCVEALREANREVLKAQAFQRPLTETVENVIEVIEGIGDQLTELESACADGEQ